MKILVVSDTHGSLRNLDEVMEREQPFDMILHLGDAEGTEDYLDAVADCPVHIVRGNNDFFSDLPPEEEFELKGHRVFMTHGHRWYVSMGEERLIDEATKRGVDLVFYGHTHRPSIHREKGMIIMNPGSVAYPRQAGRHPSYILMEIDKNKKVDATIKYL